MDFYCIPRWLSSHLYGLVLFASILQVCHSDFRPWNKWMRINWATFCRFFPLHTLLIQMLPLMSVSLFYLTEASQVRMWVWGPVQLKILAHTNTIWGEQTKTMAPKPLEISLTKKKVGWLTIRNKSVMLTFSYRPPSGYNYLTMYVRSFGQNLIATVKRSSLLTD